MFRTIATMPLLSSARAGTHGGSWRTVRDHRRPTSRAQHVSPRFGRHSRTLPQAPQLATHAPREHEPRVRALCGGLPRLGRYWARTSDPQLVGSVPASVPRVEVDPVRLLDGVSAVDDDRLPGYVAGRLRGKVCDEASDLFSRPVPAHAR